MATEGTFVLQKHFVGKSKKKHFVPQLQSQTYVKQIESTMDNENINCFVAFGFLLNYLSYITKKS